MNDLAAVLEGLVGQPARWDVPDLGPNILGSEWTLLGDMHGDFSTAHTFIRRRLREAAQPGWKSRAGKRRR